MERGGKLDHLLSDGDHVPLVGHHIQQVKRLPLKSFVWVIEAVHDSHLERNRVLTIDGGQARERINSV